MRKNKQIKPNKDRVLKVRLSDDEHKRLQELTKLTGLSMSAIVRNHIGKLTIHNRQDERQRIIALNRINANLNMIAKWVNVHKNLADTIHVIDLLITIEREIKEL